MPGRWFQLWSLAVVVANARACTIVSHPDVKTFVLERSSLASGGLKPVEVVIGLQRWMEGVEIGVELLGASTPACYVDHVNEAPMVQGELDRPHAYRESVSTTGFALALGPPPARKGCQPDASGALDDPSRCAVSFTAMLSAACDTSVFAGADHPIRLTCPSMGGMPSPPPPLPPQPPPPPTACDLDVTFVNAAPDARYHLSAQVFVREWVEGAVLQLQWYGCRPAAFESWAHAVGGS